MPTLVHVSQELRGEEQALFEEAAGRLVLQLVENLQETSCCWLGLYLVAAGRFLLEALLQHTKKFGMSSNSDP